MIGPERAPCSRMIFAASSSSSRVVTPGRAASLSASMTVRTRAPALRRPAISSGVSADIGPSLGRQPLRDVGRARGADEVADAVHEARAVEGLDGLLGTVL